METGSRRVPSPPVHPLGAMRPTAKSRWVLPSASRERLGADLPFNRHGNSAASQVVETSQPKKGSRFLDPLGTSLPGRQSGLPYQDR